MAEEKFIKYLPAFDYSDEEMIEISKRLLDDMKKRRTVRMFSDKPVDLRIIENN